MKKTNVCIVTLVFLRDSSTGRVGITSDGNCPS